MRILPFCFLLLTLTNCKINTGGQSPPVSLLEHKLLKEIQTDFGYDEQTGYYKITEKLKADLLAKYAELILSKDTAWVNKTFIPITKAKTIQDYSRLSKDSSAGVIKFTFERPYEDTYGKIHQLTYSIHYNKSGRIYYQDFQSIIGQRID